MLDYIADTLGKPKRALFGLLGGRASELMNLLPFSDAMGLTDPSTQTRGEDLTGSPVSGFLLDLLGDPMNLAMGAGGVMGAMKGIRALRGAGAASPLLAEAQGLRSAAAAEKAATAGLGRRAGLYDDAIGANWSAMHGPMGDVALPPTAKTLAHELSSGPRPDVFFQRRGLHPGVTTESRTGGLKWESDRPMLGLHEGNTRTADQLYFGRGGLLQDMMRPDFIKANPLGDEGFLQQLLANTARPNVGLPNYY